MAEFNLSRFAPGHVFIAAPLAVRVFWGCASATSGEWNRALVLWEIATPHPPSGVSRAAAAVAGSAFRPRPVQ